MERKLTNEEINKRIEFAEQVLGAPLQDCQKLLLKELLKHDFKQQYITIRPRVSTTPVIMSMYRDIIMQNLIEDKKEN